MNHGDVGYLNGEGGVDWVPLLKKVAVDAYALLDTILLHYIFLHMMPSHRNYY